MKSSKLRRPEASDANGIVAIAGDAYETGHEQYWGPTEMAKKKPRRVVAGASLFTGPDSGSRPNGGGGGLDASRVVACDQLMVHWRGIMHAPVCGVVLRSVALRQRIETAFLSRPLLQAPFVMGVVALRKCTRTSEHCSKQGSSHEKTHRFPPLFSLDNVRPAELFKGRIVTFSGRII